jgi:hypothetical protein
MAGVNGPTMKRLALAERVRLMRDDEGLLYRQIVDRLGISYTYAQALYTDPDGSQARARKDRQAGTCIDCESPTSGSNGHARAPERCALCAQRTAHKHKRWTRETVIDAIQRFATIHGHPPTADDWRSADPDNGFPAASSVHRGGGHNQSAPFDLWSDAIEAAGFPRPGPGRRTYTEVHPMDERTGYVVLRERENGMWEIVGEREERSAISALNAALNGHAPDESRWVAVPGRFWRPRALKPRTIYDFVEDTG